MLEATSEITTSSPCREEMAASDFRGGRPTNPTFALRGVNHLALVCRNMARTVEFYRDILGMPLVKTVELPFGQGQHFFFDIGNSDCLAFFWFASAPEPIEGVVTPTALPGDGNFVTAIGSMNHVAFDVAPEHFDQYRQRLIERGVRLSPVMNHDDSELTVASELYPGVYVRSMYFLTGYCSSSPPGLASWAKLTCGPIPRSPREPEGRRRAQERSSTSVTYSQSTWL